MVSARKTKSRLTQAKLTELKKKNVDKQKELSLSADEAKTLSDELVNSAIAGFEDELQKSSPAVKALATKLSSLIQEFFVGFKEGVDAELGLFVKNASKTLEVSSNKTTEIAAETIKEVAKTPKPDIIPAEIPPLATQPATTVKDILGRKPVESSDVLSKTGKTKDWLTRVGLGSIGLDDYAEKLVSQRQQKEVFVKTESKLREKEFEGMDPKDVSKKLEADFKVLQESTEKLKEVEKEIVAYKDLGYSEDQIKKLGLFEKQGELVKEIEKVDPSRTKGSEMPVPEPTGLPMQAPVQLPVSEEVATEQARAAEETAKEQQEQTTLLSEIRDILRAQNQAAPAAPAASQGGSGIGIDLPGKEGKNRRSPENCGPFCNECSKSSCSLGSCGCRYGWCRKSI